MDRWKGELVWIEQEGGDDVRDFFCGHFFLSRGLLREISVTANKLNFDR